MVSLLHMSLKSLILWLISYQKKLCYCRNGPLLNKSLGEGYNYQLLKACYSDAGFESPRICFRCLYVDNVVLVVAFWLNVERNVSFCEGCLQANQADYL